MPGTIIVPRRSVAAGGIEFVGAYQAGWGNFTATETVSVGTLTGGIASSASEGDFFIAAAMGSRLSAGSQNHTVTGNQSGAATIELQDTSGAGSNDYSPSITVVGGFEGATVNTSFDVTASLYNSALSGVLTIMYFRGVDGTTPFDVASTWFDEAETSEGTEDGDVEPPTITPTTSGAVVVCFGNHSDLSSGHTFTDDAGDFEDFFVAVGNDSIATTATAGWASWTSGTFDPSIQVIGEAMAISRAGWVASSHALRPAS